MKLWVHIRQCNVKYVPNFIYPSILSNIKQQFHCQKVEYISYASLMHHFSMFANKNKLMFL